MDINQKPATLTAFAASVSAGAAVVVKIVKKVGGSNKTQTPGKTPPASSHTSHLTTSHDVVIPTPFIDRLSVVMDVPDAQIAKIIHSDIWSQIDDKEAFAPAPKGKFGSFKLARRLKLKSVVEAKKWPLFQYGHEDGSATKLRVEFVPVDLGRRGLFDMHVILGSMMPDGWGYFIKHGRVTRIDIAIDAPFARMDEFHVLPKQGLTTKEWKSTGKLQTFQLGQGNSSHTQIYNRKAKRIAQKKSWKGKEGIRIERRLKAQGKAVIQLCDLADLPNPFSAITLVQRLVDAPKDEKKPYVWTLFRHTADQVGLPAALAILPEDKRTLYRAYYLKHALGWWDIDAIWAKWEPMLKELKIVDPKAW